MRALLSWRKQFLMERYGQKFMERREDEILDHGMDYLMKKRDAKPISGLSLRTLNVKGWLSFLYIICFAWLNCSLLATPTVTIMTNLVVLLEDSAVQTMTLTGISGYGDITIVAEPSSPSDTNSITILGVSYTSPDSTAILSFKPVNDVNIEVPVGILITVTDSEPSTYSIGFDILITPVNDPPTFTLRSNSVVALEDGGNQTVANYATNRTVGPQDETAQNYSFALSVDQTNLFSVLPSMDTSGQLTFTPATNECGTSTVAIVMTDDGGINDGGIDSTTNTFSIVILPVNDPPSFSLSTNTVVVAEDAGSQTISNLVTSMQVGLLNESNQTYSFVLSGYNTNLFTAYPVIDANGTLTFCFATNAFGTNTVVIRMVDDGGTNDGGIEWHTNSFIIVATSVNDSPVLSNLFDLTLFEDVRMTTNFWCFDLDTPRVSISAYSSDASILGVSVTGTTTNRTMVLTPVTNASGTGTVRVVANDGFISVTNSIQFTIISSNDAPSVLFTNLTILEDAAATNITLVVYDPDTDMTNITITASSDDTNLVSNEHLVLSGTGTNRIMTLTSETNAIGTNLITLIATDGTNSSTNSFSTHHHSSE